MSDLKWSQGSTYLVLFAKFLQLLFQRFQLLVRGVQSSMPLDIKITSLEFRLPHSWVKLIEGI